MSHVFPLSVMLTSFFFGCGVTQNDLLLSLPRRIILLCLWYVIVYLLLAMQTTNVPVNRLLSPCPTILLRYWSKAE